MKIAVMGTGAMGGYVAARLATGGAEVSFVARGAHLAEIRESGLKVTSPCGDMLIEPATATDDPAEIGTVDLVLLAVKMYDVETAAALIRPRSAPRPASPRCRTASMRRTASPISTARRAPLAASASSTAKSSPRG